jgi:hypothetical protein
VVIDHRITTMLARHPRLLVESPARSAPSAPSHRHPHPRSRTGSGPTRAVRRRGHRHRHRHGHLGRARRTAPDLVETSFLGKDRQMPKQYPNPVGLARRVPGRVAASYRLAAGVSVRRGPPGRWSMRRSTHAAAWPAVTRLAAASIAGSVAAPYCHHARPVSRSVTMACARDVPGGLDMRSPGVPRCSEARVAAPRWRTVGPDIRTIYSKVSFCQTLPGSPGPMRWRSAGQRPSEVD